MALNKNTPIDKGFKALIACILAWIVPGAGHAFVGRPWRGVIIFIAIGATFWGGVAMGGVMTVDHQGQKWWFAAEMLTGVHGLAGWRNESKQIKALEPKIQKEMADKGLLHENKIRDKRLERIERRNYTEKVLAEEKLALVAPMATLARAYAGVAGLLNLMCVFDVVMLALIGTTATTRPTNGKDDQQ
jgi:hypothetical protein